MTKHTIPIDVTEEQYRRLVLYLMELHPEKPTRAQIIESVRGMVVDHLADVTQGQAA